MSAVLHILALVQHHEQVQEVYHFSAFHLHLLYASERFLKTLNKFSFQYSTNIHFYTIKPNRRIPDTFLTILNCMISGKFLQQENEISCFESLYYIFKRK